MFLQHLCAEQSNTYTLANSPNHSKQELRVDELARQAPYHYTSIRNMKENEV